MSLRRSLMRYGFPVSFLWVLCACRSELSNQLASTAVKIPRACFVCEFLHCIATGIFII